jgi:hypothetical protein
MYHRLIVSVRKGFESKGPAKVSDYGRHARPVATSAADPISVCGTRPALVPVISG